MSTDPEPAVPSSASRVAMSHAPHRLSFWIRELPFTVVLLLTIGGVAYTSFKKEPIVGYWEILTPIIALVCIGYGWQEAVGKTARLRLVVTQALHWLAFLLVMNMLLLSSVQRIFTTTTTALAIFTLLALGTFTAGVQVLSWQVCLLGLIMALGVPAIAWIENSALLVVLIVAAAAGIAAVLWWHWRQRRAPRLTESAGR
jgi:Flp pilus assembly protein TadB